MRTDAEALALQKLAEDISDFLPKHGLDVSHLYPLSNDDCDVVVRYLGPTDAIGEALADWSDAKKSDDWLDVVMRRATGPQDVTDRAIGVGLAVYTAMQRYACKTLLYHVERVRELEAA